MSWLVRFFAALLVYLVLCFFFFWLMSGLFFSDRPALAALSTGALAFACAGTVWYFWPNRPRPSRRAMAAVLVYLALRLLISGLMPDLFYSDQPDQVAGVAADVLALASAAAVWYFWPEKPAPVTIEETASSALPDPAYFPRILVCSMAAGTIGFAGGFFGPMIFSPQSNQGPLLGILVTGPLGFLIGPALGVATLIRRNTLAVLPRATAWLALQFALAGAFYWLFAEVLAVLGLSVMLCTALVGVAVFVHALRRLGPSKNVIAAGAILLGGVALMLVLSAFPPVMAPWWGKPPGPESPLPAFAFILDPGFAADRNVPRYTIDRNLWALEMLFVTACVGIALMVVKIKAKAGAAAT
jgi:hypothetical protein